MLVFSRHFECISFHHFHVFITLTIPLHFKLFFVNVSIIFVIIDPKFKKNNHEKKRKKTRVKLGPSYKSNFLLFDL